MKVLILGGTGFVGRAIAALLPGRELFNRGRDATMPGLVGDRDTGDYTALRSGTWDAVVDCSGYLPRHVGEAMDALEGRVGRYLFISSHVVLDGMVARRDAVLPLTDATYGPSKVACEQDIKQRYGDRATIVRPGKVAGPHDNQSGLTHWVRLAARAGAASRGVVEVPGALTQPVQLVDSRDLAAFVARLLHDDRGGEWTAVGDTVSLGDLIHTCAQAAGTTVSLREVPPVATRVPLIKDPSLWATQHRDPAPARAAGLPATPLLKTVADVLAWDRTATA